MKDTNKIKKPWPTKDAMTQIYEMKLWGGQDFDFYSGDGSHNHEIVTPYLNAVSSFLKSFKKPLTVCDLGCGDFNIGKEFVKHTNKYIAIDIVQNLIDYNTERFKADNLEFQCLDISVDDLPSGDCVILRQVLQHLSNAEVQKVLHKLVDFKYVILTEHIPNGNFIANADIISGQGIRLKKLSGLSILEPPFNFKTKSVTEVLKVQLENNKGVIKTDLYMPL